MRGLCMYVRRRSEYLQYAYHRVKYVRYRNFGFYRLSLGLQMPDIDQT